MNDKPLSICEVLRKVEKSLKTIKYSEIIIKVQNGRLIIVDRYDRERVG